MAKDNDEEDEEKIPWERSEAKRLLREDLERGTIPLDSNERHAAEGCLPATT